MYETKSEERLLRNFDEAASDIELQMAETLGKIAARALRHEVRWELKALASEDASPDGAPFSACDEVLVDAAWLVALRRRMRARHRTVEETVAVYSRIASAAANRPRTMTEWMERTLTSGSLIPRLIERWTRDQRGDGQPSIGVHLLPASRPSQCSVATFLETHDVEELVPFCSVVGTCRPHGAALCASCERCRTTNGRDRLAA